MEDNYKLEKEYTMHAEDFIEGYTAFQKKFVYPKSYIFTGIFLVIAIIYIAAAVKDYQNTLSYVLIFISLALAAREWYNPRKRRRLYVDTFRETGDVRYKIQIADEYIDFSTVEYNNVENSEENISEDETEESPEKSRISLNNNVSLIEYDKFFLICVEKNMFYIVSKAEWTEAEIQILRDTVPALK